MSKLTINSVYTKEHIYPMLLNFLNGYPSEDFQVDCVLLRDGKGNSTVVGELDSLLYAGDEEKDFGQTFILARNRNTGHVRLIETGRAELKPVNKFTIEQLEARILGATSNHTQLDISSQTETEQIESTITQVKELCLLNSDVLKHPDTSQSVGRPNYPQLLDISESNMTTNHQHQLVATNAMSDGEKCLQTMENSDTGLNIDLSKQAVKSKSPVPIFHYKQNSNKDYQHPNGTDSNSPVKRNSTISNVSQLQISDVNLGISKKSKKIKILWKLNETDPNYSETCEKTIPNNTQLQISENNLQIKKSHKYTLPGDSELALDKNMSEECMYIPDILQKADMNASIEEQEISDEILTSTTEYSSKYDHIIKNYNDELFPMDSENNLKRKSEENVKLNILKEKELTIVKEMFVKALGLNLVPEKKRKHNIIQKSIPKNTKIKNYHRSSGTNSDRHAKFGEIANMGKDDKNASESKPFLCAYCNNGFEGKGSIIFHLFSHKFIRNTKNAVLVPLVKRLDEVTNTKNNNNRTYIGNTKVKETNKKIREDILTQDIENINERENNLPLPQGTENKKVREEILAHSNEDIKLGDDNLKRSDLATAKEKEKTLIHQKEIEKDLENFDEYAIRLQNTKQTSENNLICDYCDKTFGDKDSLIFHLIPHRYTNKKGRENNLPQDTEYINAREENSLQGAENKKVGEDILPHGTDNKKIGKEILDQGTEHIKLRYDNFMRTPFNNVASDLATAEEKAKMVINQKIIEKDHENLDDCAIHLQKEEHVLNLNQTSQNNLICDYCEKKFGDKGSLIFHLVAHRCKSDASVEVSEIKAVKNNMQVNYKEFGAVCANLSEENEMEQIIDVTSDSILSEIIVNINLGDDTIIESSKTARIHETQDLGNEEISGVPAAIPDDHEALGAAYNVEATTHAHPKIPKADIPNKVTTTLDILKVIIDKISNEITIMEALKERSNGNNVMTKDDKEKSNIVVIHEENNSNIKFQNSKVITRRLSLMNNQENEIAVEIKKENTDNTLICNECDKSFKTKVLLIAHVKKHTNNSTAKRKKKGIVFSGNSHLLNSHIKENASKDTFVCTICKHKTTSSSRLDKHVQVHSNKHKCVFCGKVFLKKSNLNVHSRCHTKEKPFKCSLCDSEFARKDTLNRHLKSHSKEKAYKCKLCAAEFKLESGLKRHLNIHAKDKKFKCTTCGSAFSEGWSLKQHMKRHTGDKPYSCDICKYSTVNSGDLKRHADTHAKERMFKFECAECSFSTNKASSLEQHMRYHTGEKPYSCDICAYSTAHVSNLKRHISTHGSRE